jgi:ketosteroid isomerase-like protein
MKSVALIVAIASFGISAAALAATPKSEVAATIKQVIDTFNKGDMKALAAMMSPDGMAIIDEIPPHVWTGRNAFDTWNKALGAYEQANGITDDLITAGKPTRVVVADDRAYAVQAVTYSFKQKGVAMQETSRMVYSLQNGKTGWLVTGFAWDGGAPKPVADVAKK